LNYSQSKSSSMRKLYLVVVIVAIAMGCVRFDESRTTSSPQGVSHTIVAVTDGERPSRLYFEQAEGIYKHFWEAEDAISVFSGTEEQSCYTLIEGADSQSGKFNGAATLGNGKFYAVYPYDKDIDLSGSTLTVDYPSVQSWRADKESYDKSCLMAAVGDKEHLYFKNITAVVRLSITGSATLTKVELRSVAGEAIAGSAQITFEGEEPIVKLNGEGNVITLNTPLTLTSEAQHLFIAIPPVALAKGFAVTIYDNVGCAMTKTNTFNRTIERNEVIEMSAFAYTATELIEEVRCVSEEKVSAGYSLMVKGEGFVAGDVLRLRTPSKSYECETKIYPDGASATIPADFESGNYSVELVRGATTQVLAQTALTMSEVPQADMLDVVFKADGTAYDASGMQSEIGYKPSATLTTYPSTNGAYVAKFTNTPATATTSGYYSVAYTKSNALGVMQNDGHTLEMIGLVSKSAKMSLFSSHQSGGTGFRVDATNGIYTNSVGFLPYVAGEYKGARGEKSQMELDEFYHLVGVWNKDTGEVVLYVDGEQAGIVTDCTGNFKHTSVTNFIIGGDPKSTTSAENSLNGCIAAARIYDKPLSAAEVKLLYLEAQKSWPRTLSINVSDVEYFPMVEVAEGWKYSVYGNGIEQGDTITLKSTESNITYTCTTTSVEGRATIVIPTGLPSDSYDLILHRGEDELKIASTTFTVTPDAELPHTTKSIAHRGYWYVDGTNNKPHNSIAALQRAQALEGCYAVELDVWATADGVLVVTHDEKIDGVTIKTANYSDIADMTLSNGEKLPTLESYLNEYLKNTSIRLMIHVKDTACLDDIIAMLREKSILDKADWLISPYADAKSVIEKCKSEAPDMVIFYPNANVKRSYSELAVDGFTLNYSSDTVNKDYSCIKNAHSVGVKILVWDDVDSKASMLKYMGLGADYLNTNRPQMLIELRKKSFIEK